MPFRRSAGFAASSSAIVSARRRASRMGLLLTRFARECWSRGTRDRSGVVGTAGRGVRHIMPRLAAPGDGVVRQASACIAKTAGVRHAAAPTIVLKNERGGTGQRGQERDSGTEKVMVAKADAGRGVGASIDDPDKRRSHQHGTPAYRKTSRRGEAYGAQCTEARPAWR